jgi:hypothetical protein
MAFGNILLAQDDDLPPPTSKPKTEDKQKPDDEFRGFKTKKKTDLSKFIIEPNVNFSIGQDIIIIGLSPYVGYKVWEPARANSSAGNTGLFLGGGVTYIYNGFRNIPFDAGSGQIYYGKANWHTYGAGVFAQYNVWRGFFGRVKFEVLHRTIDDFYLGATVQVNTQNNSYKVIIPKVEKTIPDLLVGVGYNLLQSRNFFFPIMVSYNLLYSVTDKEYSIYPRGLVVQLGFVNIF